MIVKWATIDEIPDGLLRNFYRNFLLHASSELITNVETETRVLQVGNHFFPVTINNTEWNSSYVCSSYNAYVLYAKEEVDRKLKNPIVRFILHAILSVLSIWLKSGKINQNIHVNNYLFSTNPYAPWDGSGITELTQFLNGEFPNHTIVFRSLNEYQHASLLKTFEAARYAVMASRQIYLFDEQYDTWKKRNNNYQDNRIIQKSGLLYVPHENMYGHLEEALHLYNLLYIEKYSTHNPRFTLQYFQYGHQQGWIHFQGYTSPDGKLLSFAGLFIVDNTITAPLVGYDTSLDKKLALYIHAIGLVFRYKFSSGKILNLSSGASQFKRLRGGLPVIEYSALYSRHLSWYRRSCLAILRFISNKIGIPLLKKYEL